MYKKQTSFGRLGSPTARTEVGGYYGVVEDGGGGGKRTWRWGLGKMIHGLAWERRGGSKRMIQG